MKRPRIISRPNVESARATKTMRIGERLDHLLQTKTQQMRFRRYVSDLCDWCLEIRWVNRNQLAIRKKFNLKFLCIDCEKAGKEKWQKGIVPCWSKKQLIDKVKK